MARIIRAEAVSPEEGAFNARELFIQAFGYEPEGVWSAPGRVNVIGEHVDYNGGPCLPIALPHRAYLALAPRADRAVRLISPQTADAIDVLDDDVAGGAHDDGAHGGGQGGSRSSHRYVLTSVLVDM